MLLPVACTPHHFVAPPDGTTIPPSSARYGRLCATPYSSSLRPATEPFETLHLDDWGPAPRLGPERERFFFVVVDYYSRYTTVFPLAKKSEVTSTLIRWLLTTEGTCGRRVSCLHSDRGGEFCSGILAEFCREQGIRQSWTLPESPQQNGVVEHRIGLVMEIARTSLTHARAPHFLWLYAVRYAAHQLNLWPRVSHPEASPTSLWTGSPGVASRFRVWGCLALVRVTSADKLSPRAVPCVFLGFLEDSSDFTFYHPPSHRFFDSRDDRFEESTPYYVRYPSRGLPVPPPSLFLTSAPPPAPPVQPPPPGPAPSGVSQATPPPLVAPQETLVFRELVLALLTSGVLRLGVRVHPQTSGGATSGGATSLGPGEHGRVAIGGADSGGGALGALEGGPGAAAAPDTTPPPHPYPTQHQARVRRAHEEQLELEREERELQRLEEQQQLEPPQQQEAQQLEPLQQQEEQQQPPPQQHSSRRRRRSSSNRRLLLLSLVFGPSVSPHALLPPPPLPSRVLCFLLLTPPRLFSLVLSLRCPLLLRLGPLVAPLVLSFGHLGVKRPPGSPPVFKARYVARGFSKREGVDFFQTFTPTPKMTTLRVLLHVAARRDYELHSLDFSTAFLQGSLHEEVWLRRPSAFTDNFPPGTQWRLRRPVDVLRQAPREWHDTLRSTLSDLGF
ncbi:unnamed protein product [Closterium sp. NIES-64]|nr:unnamed protein product [Closterium sp. NIES-64]